MSRRTAALVSIVSVIVLMFALNLSSGLLFKSTRLDLTERGLYTLSDGTKSILNGLEEPIELRYYFSETIAADFAQVHTYGLRVRDLLQEIAARSGGQINLQIIDPEPFSSEEDEAAGFGLTSAQTDTGERLFMGLAGTNVVDGLETIPFFASDRENYLEYDIARLITTLDSPDKPVLGLLTSLPMATGAGGMAALLQGGGAPYVVYEQLSELYEIETVDPADLRFVPEAITILMIAHPPDLSPAALYAIDQFAMRGGRLLVFVDPLAESAQGPGGQPMPGMTSSSTLGPLFEAWGVAYAADEVVLDRTRALPVQFGAQNGGVMPYVAWLRLSESDLDRGDLATAEIDTIQVASAGHIKAIEGSSTTFAPLFSTTADSQTISPLIMRYGGDPQSLYNDFSADEETYTIAARLTGPVKSAFPDGPPPELEEESAATEEGEATDTPEAEDLSPLPPHRSEAATPFSAIIAADADMLEDRFWVQTQSFLGQRIAQPTAGNGFFVLNAIENLSGSEDLITLRSRQPAARPFERVEELERNARADYRVEEERLQQQISQTEQRLEAIRARRSQDGTLDDPAQATALLSEDERAEVRRFESELAASRRALREVQRALRADVIALGNWVKFINIALVPAIVAAGAVVLAVLRVRRRRAGLSQGSAA